MSAFDSYWINEVRLPLSTIHSIPVDIYSIPSLSTDHKKSIEIGLWAKLERPSLFDGNVLYSIKTNKAELNNAFEDYLQDRVKSFSKESITHTQLKSVSKKVIERILFLIISFKARNESYFRLTRNTLFLLHNQSTKKAYPTVDIQILHENDSIKIFVVPSMSVLINILRTERSKLHEIELIRFCQFRETCPVMKEFKKCRYSFPDKIGYYIKRNKLTELPTHQQQEISEFYKECPEFTKNGEEMVWVKTSPKSSNSHAFPAYLLFTSASDIDLRFEGLYDRYRQETLLPSQKRYSLTSNFIEKIFGGKGQIKINDLVIPFANIFSLEGSPLPQNNKNNYSCQILKPLPVTVDPNFPSGSFASGGWLFQQNGSYDRNDPKRPFEKILPFVIAPRTVESKKLLETLLNCLGKDGYKKKDRSQTYYSDIDFPNLNDNKVFEKYKIKFESPSDKDIYLITPSEQEYLNAALKIKKEYLSMEKIDNNRIVLVVLPENVNIDSDHPFYHPLKKIFVEDGIPAQFISFEKLRGLIDVCEPFGNVLWNLFLDLYVKLGGKPWRLANPVSNVNCFIGVGFAINPRFSKNHIYAGVANLFDKYGNWLDVASDYQSIDEEQRDEFFDGSMLLEGTSSFKISKAVTKKIVADSLELYSLTQTKQRLYPRNIVFHKLGQIYQCEIEGILEAISESIGTFQDCQIGIASIHAFHNLRLYGISNPEGEKSSNTNRVVLRGTKISLSQNKEIIATTGKIIRREKPSYHGIGTPRPLIIEGIIPDISILSKYNISSSQFYPIEQLTSHIYSLTQLHWGSLREDIRYPITVLYAKKVADIISKSDITRINNTSINIKRPWFI